MAEMLDDIFINIEFSLKSMFFAGIFIFLVKYSLKQDYLFV